jgi:hypothetical protein
VGLCRLLPVPAGNWPFPTLPLQIFPWVPGPLPRWVPMVLSPVSSHSNIGLPWTLTGRLSHFYPAKRFHAGSYFGTAVIPLCSGPQVCLPYRSLLPLSFLTGQLWLFLPSISQFVTSLRPGYANRPNRVNDDRGLSPH